MTFKMFYYKPATTEVGLATSQPMRAESDTLFVENRLHMFWPIRAESCLRKTGFTCCPTTRTGLMETWTNQPAAQQLSQNTKTIQIGKEVRSDQI